MSARTIFWASSLLAVFIPAALAAQNLPTGKNSVMIRGQAQELYFYPARVVGQPAKGRILFLPGDGGWRGFAITMAERMASWGYDVYGLDTKRYLESFTTQTSRLTEADVMRDLRRVVEVLPHRRGQQVLLVGWSEGAGLCLLAAASEENKQAFNGLVAVGLDRRSVLGWHWTDWVTYITKKDPDEPMFNSADYLPKVSPLPLVMIHARGDEYTTGAEAQQLFNSAQEPKKFTLIEARNHHFEGNQEGFFQALREGLQWIGKPRQ